MNLCDTCARVGQPMLNLCDDCQAAEVRAAVEAERAACLEIIEASAENCRANFLHVDSAVMVAQACHLLAEAIRARSEQPKRAELTKEWCLAAAEREGESSVSAGAPPPDAVKEAVTLAIEAIEVHVETYGDPLHEPDDCDFDRQGGQRDCPRCFANAMTSGALAALRGLP